MISGETQIENHPTVEISSTVRVLRKRPCPSSSSDGASTRVRRASNPVREALKALDTRLEIKLREMQQPALQQVVSALERACPSGQFTAVCIHTGTSAAAGDSSAFEAALQYIQTICVGRLFIVRLHPSRHDSLRAVADAVAAAPTSARLVVAVEHAHLFHADLLSDVVYLLAHRCSQTTLEKANGAPSNVSPVAAMFSVPHANALHDCLTVRDASSLAATLVRMPTSHDAFDAVVDALSTHVGVLCSATVFRSMEKHFFLNDTSLSMLTRTLRQLVTLHYASSPLMDLCVWIDELNGPQVASTRARGLLLSVLQEENTLQIFDTLPSATSHSLLTKQSSSSNKERAKLYLSCLEALARWKRTVAALNGLALRIDALLNGAINDNSADEHLPPPTIESLSKRTTIFKHFLPEDGNVAPGTRYLVSLLKTVKTVPRIELRRILAFLDTELRTFPASPNGPSNSSLTYTDRVAEFIEQLDGSKPQGVGPADISDAIPAASQVSLTPTRGGGGRGRRATGAAAAAARRQHALLNSAQKAQQAGPLSAVRDGVASLLREVFAHAAPLYSLPCHEVILFDDVDALSLACGGLCRGAEPRCSIFSALRQPSSVLGALSAHKDPDATVAFRILAEGGRLVSLYDWYNIFASMRTAANMTSRSSEVSSISSAEMQARFARACSELELVGLLKYTNRKTDHVARLVFE